MKTSPRWLPLVCGIATVAFGVALLALPGLRPGGTPADGAEAPGRSGPAPGTPAGLDPPTDLGPAPDYRLTNTRGTAFGSADLAGKPHVVAFVFTRCPTICPVMSASMARIQQAMQKRGLTDRTALVSISLDPEHDTPAVLADYARRFQAQAGFWHLLTGPKDTIRTLVNQGFRLLAQDNPVGSDEPILHSPQLILVDGQGRVVAHRNGARRAEVQQMIEDLAGLASGGA